MARGAVGLFLRGTIWWLRSDIPKDLQSAYGAERIRESLKTSDRQEATIKASKRRTELLEEWSAKRKTLNAQPLEAIDPELAQTLAKAGHEAVLQRDQDMRDGKDGAFKALRKGIHGAKERQQHPIHRIRMSNSGWPTPDELPELIPLGGISQWEAGVVSEVNTGRLKDARENIARGNLLYFLPLLQWDAQAMGLTISMETHGLKEALQAYTQSYVQALQKAAQRDAGELIHTDSTPPLTSAPNVSTGTPTASGGHTDTTLMEVYGRWLKIKTRTKSTEQAYKLAVEWCEVHLGKPLHVQRLTRDQGDSFRSWLQESDRGISKKTARDRLTAIKSLLVYAYRDLGLIDKQPWEGLDIKVSRTPTRRSWKDEELQQLFGQPLFQAYDTPKGSKNGSDAAYWIPLLGLYTGARIGELAQLLTTDITDAVPVKVVGA